MNRRGMALLTVLAALSALSLLSATVLADARWSLRRAERRGREIEDRWAREACVELLRSRRTAPRDRVELGGGRWCDVRPVDPGAQVHRASSLAPLLAAQGGSAAARLTDLGDGRLSLAAAPPELLSLLPGFDAGAVQVVLRQQRRGRPFSSMDAFVAALTPVSRRSVLAEYRALVQVATPRSDVIAVVVRGGRTAEPSLSTTLFEARVVGDSLLLLGRRAAT